MNMQYVDYVDQTKERLIDSIIFVCISREKLVLLDEFIITLWVL